MTGESPTRLRRRALACPRLRRAGLGLSPLLASVLLVACAGESSSVGTGSRAGDRGAVSAAGGQDMMDAQAAFARCMRKQGIDFPDPRPGGGFEFNPGEEPALMRRIEEAEQGCDEERRAVAEAAPRLSAEDRREALEAGLRYARCMRELGQDVPDPRAQGEGGGLAVELPAEAGSDPAFQRANRDCGDILRESRPDAP